MIFVVYDNSDSYIDFKLGPRWPPSLTSRACGLPSDRHEGQRAHELLEAQLLLHLEAEVQAREERQAASSLHGGLEELFEALALCVGQPAERGERSVSGRGEAQQGGEHRAVPAAHLRA